MKKKVLIVTMATVLALSMTACGGKETETPITDTSVTVEQTVEEAKDEQSGLTVSEVRAIVETLANSGTYTYDDGLAVLMTENNISEDFARDVMNAYITENTDAFPVVLEGEEATEVDTDTPAWMQTEAWANVMRDYERDTNEENLGYALDLIKRGGWTGSEEDAIMHAKLEKFTQDFWVYFSVEEAEGIRPSRTEIINYTAELCNSTPELAEGYLMMRFDYHCNAYTEEGTIEEIPAYEMTDVLKKIRGLMDEEMRDILF